MKRDFLEGYKYCKTCKCSYKTNQKDGICPNCDSEEIRFKRMEKTKINKIREKYGL